MGKRGGKSPFFFPVNFISTRWKVTQSLVRKVFSVIKKINSMQTCLIMSYEFGLGSTRQSGGNERHREKNPNRKESVEGGCCCLLSLIFQAVLPMLRSFQGFVVPLPCSSDKNPNLIISQLRNKVPRFLCFCDPRPRLTTKLK